MSKHTPGPWSHHEDNSVRDVYYNIIADAFDMKEADARLIAAAPDLLEALKNAAATIGAIYQWLDRVEKAGGATTIEGVSVCHAMLKSLRTNAPRAEKLVMEPARAAIAKAEGRE